IQNEDEDPEVRWAAAEALGEIGDARAFEPLFAALQASAIGGAAREALARVLSAESIPALVDALKHDRPEVRLFARGALVGWWGSSAVGPLASALQSRDPEVRSLAAAGLSHTEVPE